jgi:raffinose/stachyose/melibiose transport system permease protein
MLISSFKTSHEIIIKPLTLPTSFSFVNYVNAWKQANISMYFINSMIVVLTTTVIVLIISGMSAYVIARIWPNLMMYGYLCLGMMVPIHVLLIPNKIILLNIGIKDGRLGLTLVYIAVYFSLSFFILHGFLKTIPKELEESATVDGCSRTRTFFQIIVPIAKPGFATAGIMVLYQAWNEYLLPLCLITSTQHKLLPQGIQDLRAQYTLDYGLIIAGILLSVIPVVILYTLFQRNIVKGVTAGAVKG